MKTENKNLIETWRKLQTSDHFYYMCTKWSEDGDVHAYFSPYQSPYDAYIAFMNALSDLQLRVSHYLSEQDNRLKELEEKVNEQPEEKEIVINEVRKVEVKIPVSKWQSVRNWFNNFLKRLPFFSSSRHRD